jgi:hypothetical protein
VHCSWMNQVEQWFSILQRKRLQAPNFDDLHHLEQKLGAFIANRIRRLRPSTGTRNPSRRPWPR